METEGMEVRWECLNKDILERIGRALCLRDLLSARRTCRHWRQHVSAAVTHLLHEYQPQHPDLLALDAQPHGCEGVWNRSLQALAACLPNLTEIMVYVSSRVSSPHLGEQLLSLPASLPGLTKLELRYIVPSSLPCLGTILQQLQPALVALTGLGTLYLIMGASPESSELTSVLPALPALRDLKLLSGLPQYGLTNPKLEALGCATQLSALQLEVSGVGQVDGGLAALSRLRQLRQLRLDGLVTLGPAVVGALRQLPELQELKLELDSAQHVPDVFALPSLRRLRLTYHGDEMGEVEELPPDATPTGTAAGTDWHVLEALVRGQATAPVLQELGLMCCCFPVSPLPRIALLIGLTSLVFYDCRWPPVERPPLPWLAAVPLEPPPPPALLLSATAPAIAHPGGAGCQGSWSALTTLTRLEGFSLAQSLVPAITPVDLAALAAAWPQVKTLQLQSPLPSQLQPPPASFGAFLCRWSQLESLTLSGIWCNDPRVTLDVDLLPPSLTNLVVSSLTLVRSAAARGAVLQTCGAPAAGLRLPSSRSWGVTELGPPMGFKDSSTMDAARPSVNEFQQRQGTAHASATADGVDFGWQCSTNADTIRHDARGGAEAVLACVGEVPAQAQVPDTPLWPAMEHLVLGEVRLGRGVTLAALVRWAPNLRSLEINNLLPNLTDRSCSVLGALTALTALHVSQDQEADGQAAVGSGATTGQAGGEAGPSGERHGGLTGLGLTALTGLRNLRQLEWLPWGCEPLGLEHVEALACLRRLHLVTLRGTRDGALAEGALEALRERLPLCDVDDTEWSGLVDV